MSDFELSWYLKINNQRNCGVKPKATLADSYQPIKTVLNNSGVVSIELIDCPEVGSRRLQLLKENGKCTITLGNSASIASSSTRGLSWRDLNASTVANSKSSKHGVKQLVCNESSKIYEIVENFFESGCASCTV